MPGAGLSDGCTGKALSEMPAFQPYWGKPDVRNDRGWWKRRHHSKPATRHCPTRLRGAISDGRTYRDLSSACVEGHGTRCRASRYLVRVDVTDVFMKDGGTWKLKLTKSSPHFQQ